MILKLIFLLMIVLFCCASCNEVAQENDTTKPAYQMPSDIEYKFSDEEVNDFNYRLSIDKTARYESLVLSKEPILSLPDELPPSLMFNSGIEIEYPETGVRGIYLTVENISNQEYFDEIIEYIEGSELNSVVIDYKTDWGYIANEIDSENQNINNNRLDVDMKSILNRLEEHQIFPIARIVVFKDNLTAEAHPDLSFFDIETGEVWEDANGSKYINPFLVETWDYILEIAEEAAQLGFKDIQFDYIRFPEAFHEFEPYSNYNIGNFADYKSENPEESGYERVEAINQFLDYAENRLNIYNVDISADVFGYTAVAGDVIDVRGIGQNFIQMSERVDTVSAMIYPSHWSPGFFGYDYPDIYPYEFIDSYIQEEKFIVDQYVTNDINTRPWLQDFTWYGAPGTYLEYGPNEVEAQIRALAENGIHEYLLWNANGDYSRGVDYYQPDSE